MTYESREDDMLGTRSTKDLTPAELLLLDLNIKNFGEFKEQIKIYLQNNPVAMDYLNKIQPKPIEEMDQPHFTRGNQFRLISLAHYLIAQNHIPISSETTTPDVFKKLAKRDDIKNLLLSFYIETAQIFEKKQETLAPNEGTATIMLRALIGYSADSIKIGWAALSTKVSDLLNTFENRVKPPAAQQPFFSPQGVLRIAAKPESAEEVRQSCCEGHPKTS